MSSLYFSNILHPGKLNIESLAYILCTNGICLVAKLWKERSFSCKLYVRNPGTLHLRQCFYLQVTYKRLSQTLKLLQKASDRQQQQSGRLPEVLFGKAKPRFDSTPPTWKPMNKRLDASQVQAVNKALAAQDVALIHGPPGTGKTTAVVELILQEQSRGRKVGSPHSNSCRNTFLKTGNCISRCQSLTMLHIGILV